MNNKGIRRHINVGTIGHIESSTRLLRSLASKPDAVPPAHPFSEPSGRETTANTFPKKSRVRELEKAALKFRAEQLKKIY